MNSKNLASSTSAERQHVANFVKHMVSTDDIWALRALLRIYENQTADEKSVGTASHDNGVGFTGTDAEILTSFVKYYQRQQRLTPKQMAIVRKKMHKYSRQIIAMSDESKLKAMAANWTPASKTE